MEHFIDMFKVMNDSLELQRDNTGKISDENIT
jgi:hypothetical protein